MHICLIQALQADLLRVNNEVIRCHKVMEGCVSATEYQLILDQKDCLSVEVESLKLRLAERTAERDAAVRESQRKQELLDSSESEKEVLNAQLSASKKLLAEKDAQLDACSDLNEVLNQEKIDAQSIIEVLKRRKFAHNSDATSLLNGDFFMMDPMQKGDLAILSMVNALAKIQKEEMARLGVSDTEDTPELPHASSVKPDSPKKPTPKSQRGMLKPRNTYSFGELTRLGIDTSNLPKGAKLIRRKDNETGEDKWIVRVIIYEKDRFRTIEQEVGRFNVPKEEPQNSKSPDRIIPDCPVSPSFARFYLEMKIEFNLSEQRILKMIKTMDCNVRQSTLNDWMQKIMNFLRGALDKTFQTEIRKSTYTQNDEVRIEVRSKDESGRYKYNMEYIHGALSPEIKLVYLYYDEGSRSHEIPLKVIFKDSLIEAFTADRASIYSAIEKELKELGIIRIACWFHARHKFVDAFLTDHRMLPVIESMNGMFAIDRDCAGKSAAARYEMRQRFTRPIVDRIFKMLEGYRKAGNEYGKLVQDAVNYMLDDEQAFRRFLENGKYEMHNNAAERMFRHIAMGRRNWLHTGSHNGAANLAFMYSLYESCQLNKLNFGVYIEDILTRLMHGDKDYEAMLPNHYKPQVANSMSEKVA